MSLKKHLNIPNISLIQEIMKSVTESHETTCAEFTFKQLEELNQVPS